MALFEEKTLSHSIEIRTSPEKIFTFFYGLVDDESYRAWHPEDHTALRWLRGKPWEEGSVVYAEEYIHGKLHRLKFKILKVIPNEEIIFAPLSRINGQFIDFTSRLMLLQSRFDFCCLYNETKHRHYFRSA